MQPKTMNTTINNYEKTMLKLFPAFKEFLMKDLLFPFNTLILLLLCNEIRQYKN